MPDGTEQGFILDYDVEPSDHVVRSKYDWDELRDGKPRFFQQDVHYTSQRASFVKLLRDKARDAGMNVNIQEFPKYGKHPKFKAEGVEFQFVGGENENRLKEVS